MKTSFRCRTNGNTPGLPHGTLPFTVCHLVWWMLNSRRNNRSEEHTSELQSRLHLVCRLLLEKKKKNNKNLYNISSYYYYTILFFTILPTPSTTLFPYTTLFRSPGAIIIGIR